jgi:5-methylcytosine-specific restriction endonuclease McrA
MLARDEEGRRNLTAPAHGARGCTTALSACEGAVQLRICNGCGGHYQPYHNSRGRCRDCLRQYERERRQRRGSTAQRGYGRAWQELRRVQLARQPYCSECGATADLTVDHIVPRSKRRKQVVEPANPLPILQRDEGGDVKDGFFRTRSDDPRRSFRRKKLSAENVDKK